MDAVIFIGIPGSGKSTFFRERLFRTHVRVNLDMLRTRYREQVIFDACLAGKAAFVVDNTNVTIDERRRYISAAKAAGFRVRGYFFKSQLADCLQRNLSREGDERVPDIGIKDKSKHLQLPAMSEGFDELWFVQIDETGKFQVEEWKDAV